MAADNIHITFHDHWSEVLLKFRCMSRTGKSLASSPKGWSISYDMWELAKKSDQKRTFVLVDVLMLAKPPLKKRHTCWTSQCVRSIGTIFPFLYLIGWSNSMDHKSRSRTKTDLKHNYPWISPPSHEQLKPLSKEKVNGYPGCLETPRLAPARCKRGSKMPGKSMHHMSWIKQNGREWNGTPDEFFFFFSRKNCRWLAGFFLWGERLTTRVGFAAM